MTCQALAARYLSHRAFADILACSLEVPRRFRLAPLRRPIATAIGFFLDLDFFILRSYYMLAVGASLQRTFEELPQRLLDIQTARRSHVRL